MHLSALSAQLAERHGLSKARAQTLTRSALDLIATALASGEQVSLDGFGTFAQALQPPRSGTVAGRPYQVGQRATVRFRAARVLRERLVAPE